jgi:serpin B
MGVCPVKMMSGKVSVGTGLTSDYQVIDLPYGNGAFSMTILLPNRHDDVNAIASRLDGEEWDRAIGLITSRQELEVSLPRFRLEYETNLNDALKAMGMPQAFVPGGADFSGMSMAAGPDLYISEVKHKTFVQVDEEGTEAAAATQVGVSVVSLPVGIRVDRPFIVAIRERLSGTILFLGKVVEPTE